MTGQFFLHLGPPKTATTSLQVAFEALDHPSYAYEGAFQPRHRNDESLASFFHQALLGDEEAHRNAKKRLTSLLSDGKTVLVSEEMLSLEQNGIATATKIARLGKILAGLKATILITLRDPVDALPSLYQELYPSLPWDLQRNFPRFCSSGQSECFEYTRLADQLARVGLSNVRWLDYRRIGQQEVTTTDIFGEDDLWGAQPLALSQLNVSARKSGGKQRQLPSVTGRAIGRNQIVKRSIDRLGLRGGRLVRFGSSLLDRIQLSSAGSRELLVPPDRAKELADSYETLRLKAQKQT